MNVNVNEREVYRYLGFGKTEPDERTKTVVSDSLSELIEVAGPRFFSREYPLTLTEDGEVDLFSFRVKSRALYKNLHGCDRVILFAATIGAEADRLIRRYSKLEMSKAVIMQAAGAALIEALCDEENERLRETYLRDGSYLRPRFSPGYGDFPLSAQKGLLLALEADKRVGITLTEGYLMIPSKSVTAVIGVENEKKDWGSSGCGACGRDDCHFRR